MMRLLKFLLGIAAGAAAGMLFAPKSGRELREQVFGGAAARLLPPVAEHYPLPEGKRVEHEDAAPLEQPPITLPYAEATATEAPTDEPPLTAVEPLAPVDSAGEDGEDLLTRIRETRASVEAELADPFGPDRESRTGVAATSAADAPAPVEPPPAEEGSYWDLTPGPSVEPEPEPERNVFADLWTDEPVLAAAPAVEEPVARETDVPADTVVIPPASPARQWEVEAPAEVEAQAPVEPPAEAVAPVETPPPPTTEGPGAEIREDHNAGEGPGAGFAEPTEADETPAAVADAPPIAVEARPDGSDEAPVSPAETAAPEGGPVDQAEMRRRIEETRARLKAKAFDAMMSGESALLRSERGTKTVVPPSDTSLEPDIDSTIDQSLSQEDY